MEEDSACSLSGRAFGTEATELGEGGMEEGGDVGGGDVVGEEAWRGCCPRRLLGRRSGEGG